MFTVDDIAECFESQTNTPASRTVRILDGGYRLTRGPQWFTRHATPASDPSLWWARFSARRKLSTSQVDAMRRRYRTGLVSQARLAREHNVSAATVERVLAGRYRTAG